MLRTTQDRAIKCWNIRTIKRTSRAGQEFSNETFFQSGNVDLFIFWFKMTFCLEILICTKISFKKIWKVGIKMRCFNWSDPKKFSDHWFTKKIWDWLFIPFQGGKKFQKSEKKTLARTGKPFLNPDPNTSVNFACPDFLQALWLNLAQLSCIIPLKGSVGLLAWGKWADEFCLYP